MLHLKIFSTALALLGCAYVFTVISGFMKEDKLPKDESTKCQACLMAGKDFCISKNQCIPRATYQCKGPYDHITGDTEFAMHGNPQGIQHSMVCPAPHQNKDCYFDKECHAKVNWENIKEIKSWFFERVKNLAPKRDVSSVKTLMSQAHEQFLKAGMPDDRIDYILEKWVKHLYPEALSEAATPPQNKDCYFDKECHAKVNWEKITEIKSWFFERVKHLAQKRDVSSIKTLMSQTHEQFLKAGMPDDRIDYILEKWVKYIYPEALAEIDAASERVSV